MKSGRASVNTSDYPEHLNPFHDNDNHAKLRFWSITKKTGRSNSISFQSLKDFKNTLGRSFSINSKNKRSPPSAGLLRKSNDNQVNLRPSERQTVSYDGRYVHQGSRTPLPRTRFHERVKHLEPERSQASSMTSVNTEGPLEYNNPFNDAVNLDRTLSLSRPQTLPRKKKRAPPPPPVRQSSIPMAPVEVTKITSKDIESEVLPEQINDDAEVIKIEISAEKIKNTDPDADIHATKFEEISKKGTENKMISEDSIADTTHEQSTYESKKYTLEKKSDDINEKHHFDNIKDVSEEELYTDKSEEISVDIIVNNVLTQNSDDMSEKIIELACKEQPADEPKEDSTENFRKESDDTIEQHSVDNTEEVHADELHVLCKDSIDEKSIETFENEESSEVITSASDSLPNKYELNFNSELTMSSSENLISSVVHLEQKQQAVEDTSDLMEMVQKLQMEVQKLTDDTNNNTIQYSENDNEQRFNGHCQNQSYSPTKVKTEINILLDSDDNDVITNSIPTSPRFIRLRKDNEWIKQCK